MIGITITCAGSWIKILAVRNPFWVAFIGQSVVALGQVFVLSVPARLAAVWFGPSQVSSACSIGVFGNQVREHLINEKHFFGGVKLTRKEVCLYMPAIKFRIFITGSINLRLQDELTLLRKKSFV